MVTQIVIDITQRMLRPDEIRVYQIEHSFTAPLRTPDLSAIIEAVEYQCGLPAPKSCTRINIEQVRYGFAAVMIY